MNIGLLIQHLYAGDKVRHETWPLSKFIFLENVYYYFFDNNNEIISSFEFIKMLNELEPAKWELFNDLNNLKFKDKLEDCNTHIKYEVRYIDNEVILLCPESNYGYQPISYSIDRWRKMTNKDFLIV